MNESFDKPGTAGERMPFGQPVRRDADGLLRPLRIKLDWRGAVVAAEGYDGVLEMVGVLRRTTGSVTRMGVELLTHAEAGEKVMVRTEGHIIGVDGDGMTISFTLVDGRAT